MKLFSLIAASLLLTSVATRAQSPVSRGGALVKEFCAGCHAIGKTDRSPHSDAPPLRGISNTIDLDKFPRALIRGISSGHPDMPQIKFSPQDARAVRDYLRTIQK